MWLGGLQEAIECFDFFVINQKWDVIRRFHRLDNLDKTAAFFSLDLVVGDRQSLLELRLVLILYRFEIKTVLAAVPFFANSSLLLGAR